METVYSHNDSEQSESLLGANYFMEEETEAAGVEAPEPGSAALN